MSSPFSESSTSLNQSSRLLIVEGDLVTRTHLQMLLAKSDYELVMAEDGCDALRYLQSDHPPRLAVVGWTCSKLSGIEICRQISDFPNRNHFYVILLINWSQHLNVAEALEAGADDCVYKPVDIRELRVRLQTGSRVIAERALSESEERFRLAFEQAAMGMSITDLSGRFLQVNQALCRLLGYSSQELLQMNILSLSHPENVPPPQEFIQHLIKDESHRETERRFLCKDGSVVWTSVAISRMQSDSDQPVIATQFQNITERKAAEDALRRSEAFARALTDNIEDLVMVIDLSRKLQYVSQSHLLATGYAPSELVGRDALSIVHSEDSAMFEEVVRALQANVGGRLFATRLLHKNGSVKHFEGRGSLVRGLLGGNDAIVVVSRAIDDRIQAEQELKAAHAETELFLESVPSILIGLDSQGRITRWNRSATEAFGLSSEHVMGRRIDDCDIRWLHKEMSAEVERWLQAKGICRCEDLAYEQDGKRCFLGLTVRRLESNADSIHSFIITGADITERRMLEGQLRQAQKLEAIGQLAAGVAHEINTPTQYVGDNATFLKESWTGLAKILTLAQGIRETALKGGTSEELLQQFDQAVQEEDLEYLLKEVPHAIEQSLEGVQRVAKIVKGMKEFSHPGAEEKRAVDINRAIETTVTVARNEWKYVAEMVTDLQKDLPLVPCLAGEFNQVILNLIINAAHAIADAIDDGLRERGTITIGTRLAEHAVQVLVKDDGIGIAPEIQSRIFEPFFTTKPVGQGTGQGLALAHSVIVVRHQGKMWFETEAGKGTTFFVQLPLLVAECVS